ncbi:MAG: hypothetical protein HY519_04475 [Candidatus Aenigmarchaeota archaeon]|nr:hypothetical protein [Candidatus Aenigmarchaeota archaeon]
MAGHIFSEKPELGKLATFAGNVRAPVHSWFHYKQGFSGQLVDFFLDRFRVEGRVLDPFCGSGTTLLACARRGITAIGCDLEPIAVVASNAKLASDAALLRAWLERLKGIDSSAAVPFGLAEKKAFSANTLAWIRAYSDAINGMPPAAKSFYRLALVKAAMRCSYAYRDGAVIKFQKHGIPGLRKVFLGMSRSMLRDLKHGHYSGHALFADATRLPFKAQSFSAIITSPPYLGQLDYHAAYAVENWLASGASAPLALGGKRASNSAYLKLLERFVAEAAKVLEPNAPCAIIVGNGYADDKVVPVDEQLAAMAGNAGFKVEQIMVLNRRYALQDRTRQAGVLRESAVLLTA